MCKQHMQQHRYKVGAANPGRGGAPYSAKSHLAHHCMQGSGQEREQEWEPEWQEGEQEPVQVG